MCLSLYFLPLIISSRHFWEVHQGWRVLTRSPVHGNIFDLRRRGRTTRHYKTTMAAHEHVEIIDSYSWFQNEWKARALAGSVFWNCASRSTLAHPLHRFRNQVLHQSGVWSENKASWQHHQPPGRSRLQSCQLVVRCHTPQTLTWSTFSFLLKISFHD